MKKSLLVLFLLSTIIYAQDYVNRSYLTSSQIRDKIYSNLEKIDLYFLNKLNKKDYSASKELLLDSYLLLFSIPDFEFDNHYVMIDSDFEFLLSEINQQSFTEDKLLIIEAASVSNYFTVAQIYKILETIDFSSDRIDAFRMLFPSIADKYNSYRIISLFQNSADKQTIRNLISNYFNKRR
jgi:hypothetical protein